MDEHFAQTLIIIELGYRAYGRLLVDTTTKRFSKIAKDAIKKTMFLRQDVQAYLVGNGEVMVVERSDLCPVG